MPRQSAVALSIIRRQRSMAMTASPKMLETAASVRSPDVKALKCLARRRGGRAASMRVVSGRYFAESTLGGGSRSAVALANRPPAEHSDGHGSEHE